MSRWRQAIYAAVTVVAVLLAAEGMLGLAGVRPITAVEDPYVGFSGRLPLFVEATGPDGVPLMTTAQSRQSLFNRQSFRRDKPPGAYRIFCLGGSTTYGHPYDDAMSFCGWLRRFLRAAAPSRTWEVVNAGGISYASYRITALMEELSGYQPDLFIVYSGHNEFIEERSYRGIRGIPPLVMEATTLLGHSRLFTAIRHAVTLVVRGTERDILTPEVSERLARSVGPETYHRDEPVRAGILAHFRFNLTRMAALARAAGSDITFIMPAANLKDMSPFKSEHRAGLSAEDRQRWDRDFAVALAVADPARRLALLDRLSDQDGRYAEGHFERGRALLALGRHAEADAAFRRALDEDIVPLRMLPDMAESIRQVATERDVPLIDFAAMIEDWTRDQLGHGIPGAEWFADHVHVSIEGYRRLGLALLRHLQARGVLTSDLGDRTIAEISRAAVGVLDAATHGQSLMTVGTVLGWAGRLEEAHRLLLEARTLMGDTLPLLLKLGHSAERRRRPEEAVDFYRLAAERFPQSAEPHMWLADLTRRMGAPDQTLHHLRMAVMLAPDSAVNTARLAELLAARGDWPAAAKAYRDLAGIVPKDGLVRRNLAIALANAGAVDEARRQFGEARHLDPTSPDPLIGLASLHEAEGDHQGARALYADAVALAPDHAEARLNLGASLANAGALQQAIDQFRHAVRLAPDWADAHLNLARALRQSGRPDDAEPHFTAAARLSSGNLQ